MEGRHRRPRKLRIAAALRSSLSSCSPRNLSNSLPDSVFLPQTQPHRLRSFDDHLPDLSLLTTGRGSRHRVDKCASETMPPCQISGRYPPASSKEGSRRILRCPPASPITPLNALLRHRLTPNLAMDACKSSSSSPAGEGGVRGSGLFLSSSDDEDDEGTSSEHSYSEIMTSRRMGKTCKSGVEESTSYAVVKRSRDPYEDFRRSMVEMIVEKRMYGAVEMERLLEWFLWLNEGRHHAIILRAFTDIWESLHYF